MLRCTLSLSALLFCATPARADLIDLGNGLIYDTVQDLTWVQDAMLSRTIGDDPDGLMNFLDATAWATSLEYGGLSDWRLPQIERGTIYASEVARMFYQLGWRVEEPGHWNWDDSVFPTNREFGPFLNVTSQRGVWSYWVGLGIVTNGIYVDDIHDDGMDGLVGAWAVRNGAPHARVPEPTTLLFVGIGALAAIGRRRLQ